MEIVGGIASIAQLTNYVIASLASFCEVYQKARLRPEKLQQQLEQVERLRCTIEEIKDRAASRGLNVLAHLRGLSSIVDLLEEALTKLLAKQKKVFIKRFLRAWFKDTENIRLEGFLPLLEQEKSSFLLSLAGTQIYPESVRCSALPRLQEEEGCE